jgi:hypothetical protein
MTRCQHCGVLIVGPPDWGHILGWPEDKRLADNELLLVTRGSLSCAASALRALNADDYYHTNGAAEREIRAALAKPAWKAAESGKRRS